eukprot:scaffold46940_cov32-Tisochrysis_lutea.AAC.6
MIWIARSRAAPSRDVYTFVNDVQPTHLDSCTSAICAWPKALTERRHFPSSLRIQDEAIALCLKEIGMLANLEDVGASLPKPILKILRRFNGKPVLTRPEHRFYRGPSNSYLEISLDGHQYSYATRAAVRCCTTRLQGSFTAGRGDRDLIAVKANKQPVGGRRMACRGS